MTEPGNGFEDELRSLLHDRAAEAPGAPGEPEDLAARVRARRWRSRGLAGGAVMALLVAVALPTWLLGGDDTGGPAAGACRTAHAIAADAPPAGDTWDRYRLPPLRDCFSLTATRAAAGRIEPASQFVLTSATKEDADALAERLQVSPPVDFTVVELGDADAGGRFRIEPAAPLAADTLYRFSLLDEPGGQVVDEWSFQSQGALRVVATLPADRSTSVPLDAGIELTFSHDGVTGVQERFRITPAVEGRWETHKRTAVFVPKGLAPATLYTVTLEAGASVPGTGESIADDVVFRFETGADPRGGSRLAMRFSRPFWESATAEPPALGMFWTGFRGAAPPQDRPVPIAVYRFADADAFAGSFGRLAAVPTWAVSTRDTLVVPTDGLERVAEFTAVPARGGARGDLFVRLPEPLPPGFYLVEADVEGRRAQAWVQSTDVAAYAAVSGTRTVVWVNDLSSGRPVPDATVAAIGTDFSTRTGDDGVALFDTPTAVLRLQPAALGVEAESVRNLMVTAGGRSAIVPLADLLAGAPSFEYREFPFEGDPGLYWRFLYTDRQLFRMTDTINVWGLVRHREKPAPRAEVRVELRGGDGTGPPEVVASTTATTGASGTFIGKLAFAGVSPGFYQLEARVGDQVLASRYVEVEDFTSPAYSIDVVPSAPAAFAGDAVSFAIRATFFDGSPVPGVQLQVHGKAETTVTTGPDGRATVAVTAGQRDPSSGWTYESIEVTPALPEEGEIFGAGGVVVFPAALDVEADGTAAGGRATVTGTIHRVDVDRATDGRGDPADYRSGPAAGRAVSAEVEAITYRPVETGEYYDFIEKATRKTFRYDEVRRPHGTFQATTKDDGTFGMTFPAAPAESYRVRLSATDDAGRQTRWETYVSSGFESPDIPLLHELSTGPYAIGAGVEVEMRRGPDVLPGGGANRYLFMLAGNGLRSAVVQDGPRFGFEFGEEHVPNVHVLAVRFSGATYQEAVSSALVPFDTDPRRLRVEVTPDEPRHRPGEEARVGLRVTDHEGEPVEGAEVLVSAVDERIIRLQGLEYFSQIDILDELYSWIGVGVLRSYSSHLRPDGDTDRSAEAGEGGDARGDFRDLALFERVTTDDEGRAAATFELPDSITAWRVSAVAVTEDLRAGSGAAPVAAGLPVFADVAAAGSYLVSDQAVIRLRAFGDALAAGDPVEFSVASPTLLPTPLEAAGRAFEPVEVALPPLAEGRHTLTVTVRGKGASDAVRREVSVVRSRLAGVRTEVAEVPEDGTWKPAAETVPTRVVVADHNRGRWYPVLASLRHTTGDRVDQALARDLAGRLLAEHFDEGPAPSPSFNGSAYQTRGGGIAVLPFADADLTVSARIAALAPERFARQGLARSFRSVLDDPDETRERAIVALYGLAALDEHVLADVQRVSEMEDLTVREQLYSGLAAAELGDLTTAERLYRAVLESAGEQRGTELRLNVGADQDDVAEATSLAAILGAAVADEAAPRLAAYVASNRAEDLLLELEQLSFLSAALPRIASEPVRFSYTLGGERQEHRLARGESMALFLSPEAVAQLDLTVAEGTAGIARSVAVPLDPAAVQPDPDLGVGRTYSRTTVGPADLVRITLTPQLGPKAADGCHRVTDLLPSGLKAVTEPYRHGIRDDKVTHPYAVAGQRVSFCAYRPGATITYYARVVAPGSYTAEPATVQDLGAPEAVSFSAPTTVRIR